MSLNNFTKMVNNKSKRINNNSKMENNNSKMINNNSKIENNSKIPNYEYIIKNKTNLLIKRPLNNENLVKIYK